MTHFALAGGPTIQNDRFTNTGSISNTRHNLTQAPTGIGVNMDRWRNDYGEVCVYCHTPHGSQNSQNMPLWNRTILATTTYATYNSFTLTQGVAPNPGNNSRMCLTCHDGQTAIDSIINMPGSGMGRGLQGTTQNTVFLNTWNNPVTDATNHMGLNSSNGVLGDGTGNGAGPGCLVCHSDTGAASGGLADFSMFLIGTDLTNDHPIGIDFPLAASGIGYFNQPDKTKGTAKYFDGNANSQMDKNEVRLYGTGGPTVQVECASCHDPHGVPDPANGNVFKPTFLRVANNGATGSALCLTCHNK